MTTPEINFETALKELEAVVATLEKGETSLEESISLYEKGMKLANICGEKLQNARSKIITLNQAEEENND